MTRPSVVTHQFVDQIPTQLQDGVLYVSIPYATVVHRCLCGCGTEVVTPLTPTDWSLTFDGETVSLDPSVGNWSFPCRSHYWITGNRVRWAPSWSKHEIEVGRAEDKRAKARFFDRATLDSSGVVADAPQQPAQGSDPWARFRRWWSRR